MFRLLVPSSGGLDRHQGPGGLLGQPCVQLPQFPEIPGVTSHLYHFMMFYIHSVGCISILWQRKPTAFWQLLSNKGKLFILEDGHQSINRDSYTQRKDSHCGMDDHTPSIPCSLTMVHTLKPVTIVADIMGLSENGVHPEFHDFNFF